MSSEVCGVGVDCEQVSRLRNLNEQFFRKNFTEKEIQYCNSRPDPSAHFAARFACKEAAIKAFSCAGERVFFSDIEIISRKNAAPDAVIKKRSLSGYRLLVSMSHSGGMAIAFAVLVK